MADRLDTERGVPVTAPDREALREALRDELGRYFEQAVPEWAVDALLALPEVAALLTAAKVEWEPGRWWRVVAPDGSVWCETSDEAEARESMRPGDLLWRSYRPATPPQWRPVEAST